MPFGITFPGVKQGRLDVLDGLRGIAVLLVLWYHVWEISWLPAPWPQIEFLPETGFIGVHLFFFLSGFVITWPFVRALIDRTEPPSWRHFYWRRAIKILPSYWLSIIIAYAIGYAQTQGHAPLADIVAHLFFVHTWWPETAGAINGVLWTLAIEVEFYLCFPLIWWGFRRQPWLVAGVMVLIALAWRHYATACCYNGWYVQVYENLPGYLDIFACGMLTAWAYARTRNATESPRRLLAHTLLAIAGVFGLILIMQSLFGFRLADQWAYVWQIDKRPLIGIVFACIAFGSLGAFSWWRAIFANRLLMWFGFISYNLYLYHQMIARELLTWKIPPFYGDPHFDPTWKVEYTMITIGITIAQAALFTYLVERPLLHVRFGKSEKAASGDTT